jgi:glycosyltransferase involved in cell wall biosynthesis
VTRVLVYPADEGGCGMTRLIWPTVALTRQGADVTMVLPGDPGGWHLQGQFWTDDTGTPELLDVQTPDADVVVLQRPLKDLFVHAIPMLQARGIKVVVEIDDDFDAISRRNVSWENVQPHLHPTRNKAHLRRACELADLVTVTTPALAARYGKHGRVRIIPNYVPERYLHIRPPEHEGVVVGWSGSIETHPDDLQVCGGGVAQAVSSTGATFAVIGTGTGVRQALSLREPPLACGWRPIDQYPNAVAQLDVGIVPLELTPFNEAKSWLKGLEMAALGVPFVASPTGPYRSLAALGPGLLADSPKAWKGTVGELIRNAEFRANVAGQGRWTAAGLTIEGHCGEWWDAWTSVCA